MIDAAVLETKTAAQAGTLYGGETEYQSIGNSEGVAYSDLVRAAIEKRFPIIARHFGIDMLGILG